MLSRHYWLLHSMMSDPYCWLQSCCQTITDCNIACCQTITVDCSHAVIPLLLTAVMLSDHYCWLQSCCHIAMDCCMAWCQTITIDFSHAVRPLLAAAWHDVSLLLLTAQYAVSMLLWTAVGKYNVSVNNTTLYFIYNKNSILSGRHVSTFIRSSSGPLGKQFQCIVGSQMLTDCVVWMLNT